MVYIYWTFAFAPVLVLVQDEAEAQQYLRLYRPRVIF